MISHIRPNSPEKLVAFAPKMPLKEEKDYAEEVKEAVGRNSETDCRSIELNSLSTAVKSQQKTKAHLTEMLLRLGKWILATLTLIISISN